MYGHSIDASENMNCLSDVEAWMRTSRLLLNPQNRTEQNFITKQKYLWQAARIANMAIYAGCLAYNDITNTTYIQSEKNNAK